MVGFGSSVRLARRPGWEGAYLDYEALKLLLSHIEAIYEEGGIHHHNNTPPNHNSHSHHLYPNSHQHHQYDAGDGRSWEVDDDVVYLSNDNRRSTGPNTASSRRSTTKNHHRRRQQQQRRRRQRKIYQDSNNNNHNNNEEGGNIDNTNVIRDYKVDLFLESDSDLAYLSLEDPYYYDDDTSTDENDDDDDDNNDDDEENHILYDHTTDGTTQTTSYLHIHPPPLLHATATTENDDRRISSLDNNNDGTGTALPYNNNNCDIGVYDSEDDLMIIQTKKSPGNSCWGGGSNHNTNHNNTTNRNAVVTASNNNSTAKRRNKTRNYPRSHRKGGSGGGGGNGGSSQFLLPSSSVTVEENQQQLQYYDIGSSSHHHHQQQQQQPITPPWKAAYPYYGDTFTDTTSYYYQDALHYLKPPAATTTGSTVADESTALLFLPPVFNTPRHEHNLSLSPPNRTFLWNQTTGSSLDQSTTNLAPVGPQKQHIHVASAMHSNGKNRSSAIGMPVMSTKKKQRSVQEIRQKQEHRRKRREQMQRIRDQREKKVPRHIRIAHTKARAITERFLGLLRAETEKVLLFAQSRLGELADTSGSLRFPSYDEEYASNHPSFAANQNNHLNHNTSTDGGNEYEYGDGMMHPSASSSSDDQCNGGGRYGRQQQQHQSQPQWFTDSSDDENEDQLNHHGININSLSNINSSNTNHGKNLKTDTKTTNTTRNDNAATTATRTKESDHLRYIQRQIAHFTELRKRRAIFQRNEQILGEDMLFLSAVEEVDGYTAVGVELLHTLKYICINLIAVRKICRKHDRLLMNRMLGGYYHRLRKLAQNNIAGVPTLGGMVTQISGDIYEAHPSVLGQRSHYKLVGVYDYKIQKLANSRTVQVVSSCLALSLSEYEVARSRADALTRLNSATSVGSGSFRHGKDNTRSGDTDDESLHDVPSTASNISLTRLRYTTMSIFALREVSRTKRDNLMTYLSRMSLAFTGQPVIGEGLDGCSRETLDFLVSYDPDTALLRDATLLYEGLKQNRWSHLPLGDVMISSLAIATIQGNVPPDIVSIVLPSEECNVAYAVSANPESNVDFWKAMLNGQSSKVSALSNRTVVMRYLPPIVLRLSRTSLFLYSFNYFLSHATAATFVKAAGSPASYSALLIGAPNLSATIMAMIHCWYGTTREVSTLNNTIFSFGAVKTFLIFGTLMGIIGSGIQGYAINKSSIPLAIVGRLCLGFASAEILQRELTSMCVPVHVLPESGKLTMSKMVGSFLGLVIGTLSAVPIAIQTLDIGRVFSPHTRQLQWSSWMMMAFWIVHLFFVLAQCTVKHEISPKQHSESIPEQKDLTTNAQIEASKASDSESSSSVVNASPSTVLSRPFPDSVGPMASAISSMENISSTVAHSFRRDDDLQDLRRNRPISRQWRILRRLRKLFDFHVGIPITILIYAYTSFSMEVFCTSTPFITDRYFSWSGARAGTFLACLLSTAVPVTVVCEIVARRYEERSVIKRALTIGCIGLFIMINWQSMFALVELFPSLLADTQGRLSHPYDGKLGVVQYVIGLIIFYISLIALDGATLSLLSKLSPINIRSILVNISTVSTFIGLIARLLGDIHIVTIDSSHKLINTDLINSLVVPLILMTFLITYLLKKNFFALT